MKRINRVNALPLEEFILLKREVAKRIFAKEFEACRELEKAARSDSEALDSKRCPAE